jgi:hypothetical protein
MRFLISGKRSVLEDPAVSELAAEAPFDRTQDRPRTQSKKEVLIKKYSELRELCIAMLEIFRGLHKFSEPLSRVYNVRRNNFSPRSARRSRSKYTFFFVIHTLSFVLFASFVVSVWFPFLVAALPRCVLCGEIFRLPRTVGLSGATVIKIRLNHRLILSVLVFLLAMPAGGQAQDPRKIRISNATLSYSALPLVAAKEWKLFQEQGLDVEIILMRSAAAARRRWLPAIWITSPASDRRA